MLAARPFGAHIEFLHARVDVTEVVVAMSAGGVGGGGAVQSVVDRLEEDSKAQEAKAWAAFTAFCEANKLPTGGSGPGAGLCADMIVETGNESQWIAEYGRFADLVVVGRRRDTDDVALDVLEAALMDTGKPLLIAPAAPPAKLLGTVVIAWKDTPEAARAVASAMPLIDNAEKVVILAVGEGETTGEPSAERLQRALRWHNPATTVQVLDRGPGIPAADAERMLQPFTRLNTARSTSGSGLGLAIVDRIAKMHGGCVQLLPRAGGGLEARVELPLR